MLFQLQASLWNALHVCMRNGISTLPLCNQLQLEELGVPTANILQSGICTYDNASDFFSARILKEGFGTIYTGIALK